MSSICPSVKGKERFLNAFNYRMFHPPSPHQVQLQLTKAYKDERPAISVNRDSKQSAFIDSVRCLLNPLLSWVKLCDMMLLPFKVFVPPLAVLTVPSAGL